MALQDSNQYGAAYVFGITDADAPQIEGMKCRKAQIKFAPAVNEVSVNGEGTPESRTVSKPAKRTWTGTFTGPVIDSSTLAATADFTWGGRFWVITNGNNDRNPGKYAEASIEAMSDADITG